MFVSKSLKVEGNLKRNGDLSQSMSFFNSELRRGTWLMTVQSVAVQFNSKVNLVASLFCNVCLTHVETIPGQIQVNDAPLIQFEMNGKEKDYKLCYLGGSFDIALPMNNITSTIKFTVKDSLTNLPVEVDADIAIVVYYKRVA